MRIVSGEWGGRRIQAPPGRETRPTTDRVREAWMSIVGDLLPGARVVDLFAGSGALGLEALSRGALDCTFVENAPAALRVLHRNVAALDAAARSRVLKQDAMRFVDGLEAGAYDVAFADPPYGRRLAAALVTRFAEVPFAGVLAVEHAHDDELPDVPGLVSRRYGDTVLSFLTAPEAA